VNPPKLEDYQSDEDYEDDDDDTPPLTREELNARTLTRLQKRGQSGGGVAIVNFKKKVPSSKLSGAR
jgi:hypothetical protein